MLRRLPFLLVLWMALGLIGCTSGSDNGAPTEENPDTTQTGGDVAFVYAGPAPSTDDVQQFRLALWDNIIDSERCGGCHGVGGTGTPLFARTDDINEAYKAANTVVNLAVPGDSAMVQKLEAGHYCWEGASSACADIISRWIADWASTAEGSTNVVELSAPPLRDPGTSKSFPESSDAFAVTVYPLLTEYCSGCHKPDAANPQAPFFASDDVDAAYFAAQSKINLDTPENSRLVVRLGDEFHNCWSTCRENGDEMLAAINDFAGTIEVSTVDPDYVISKALTLVDGIPASSGGRSEDNLIALYQFKEGEGTVAYDSSGVDTSMNLHLSGDYEWVGGWGVRFVDGKAQALVEDSSKLYRLITATGEYSIEAWVAPNNVTQEGPARIVSYSGGNTSRNFMLGQTLYNYDFHNRTSNTDANGEPALSTPDGDEVLQATLQHVVVTYDSTHGRRMYVNGEFIDVADETEPGSLADWSDTFAFVLGSETSNEHRWQGVVRLVAIYNRAIPEAQIQKNFAANVGERFFLLFSISHVVDIPDTYVVFEVSQFDSYSYLFNKPFLVSLNESASFENLVMQGLRIGMNGKLATAGQAFVNLDASLNSSDMNEEGRIYLSDIGTVLALENGASQDEFYLVFDRLGDQTHVIVEAEPAAPAVVISDEEQPDIGIKTFDEINASMSRMTGVPITNSDVAETFSRIKQQLPTVENLQTFLASQQVAISQLAIEYCNTLLEDEGLRGSYFPAINFSAAPAEAFAPTTVLTQPLIDRMIGSDLDHDPAVAEIQPELDSLITSLSACDGTCDGDRTKTVSKAVCAAVLASATTLLQ